MQIIVHRGTHQIGGCVTEIKTEGARIIIDFGAELPSAVQDGNKPFELNGVTCGVADCDAVLITHYHGDHIGMTEKILPQIPVFLGHTAKKIYGVVQQTLKKKLDKGAPERVEDFKEYYAGKPIYFNDIKVTPYVIDHSAYDAYMFLIEAEGKRILHTGDFRLHGSRGGKMSLVFEKYAKDIDLLITEGTMLSRSKEKAISEYALGKRAKELLRDNKYVFVLCSSTNIDTIAEFYNAAIVCKKPFIVCEDDFQAEILRIVSKSSKSAFYNFNRRKVYSYGKNLHKFMSDCGFCFIGRINYTTKKAIENFPESTVVYSMWKGYLDENHPAFDDYKKAFIDDVEKLKCNVEYLHTSGHATAEEIIRICEITNAKTLIPIHCEAPENFNKLNIKANIEILKDGQPYMF